jgi:hypothetical protein
MVFHNLDALGDPPIFGKPPHRDVYVYIYNSLWPTMSGDIMKIYWEMIRKIIGWNITPIFIASGNQHGWKIHCLVRDSQIQSLDQQILTFAKCWSNFGGVLNWLVVWNIWIIFHILEIIIPTEELICFRGVEGQPPTSEK